MKAACKTWFAALAFLGVFTVWSQTMASTEVKLLTNDREDGDEVGRSVDMDGETILLGAPEEDDMGTRSGAAYIFNWSGGTWVQDTKLMAPDGVSGAQFGYAVALSGDYALVGAFRDNEHGNQAGAAYLWHRSGGSWQFVQKLVPSVPLANIEFGNAVTIDGDYAVIGAHRYEHLGEMTGAVYVFERNGATWIEDALLVEDGLSPSGFFGCSVAVSGNTLMVGASSDMTTGHRTGAVYVYNHDGVNWLFNQVFTHPDGKDNDRFGHSIAMGNGWAIVGAPAGTGTVVGSGLAYLCRYQGGAWQPIRKLGPNPPEPDVSFGWSVDINEGFAVVSAPWTAVGNIENAGKAYTYAFDGTNWQTGATLEAGDPNVNAMLGMSVAVQADEALAGAHGAADTGVYPGAGYWFQDLTAPVPTVTPTPETITYELDLIDADLAPGDQFRLSRACFNPEAGREVDEFIILDIYGDFWFWPGWSDTPDWLSWTLMQGVETDEIILEFLWPDVTGIVEDLKFWGAFLEAGTTDLIIYDMIEWGYSDK